MSCGAIQCVILFLGRFFGHGVENVLVAAFIHQCAKQAFFILQQFDGLVEFDLREMHINDYLTTIIRLIKLTILPASRTI